MAGTASVGGGSPSQGPSPSPNPNSLEENSERQSSKKKLETHNVPKTVKKDYLKIDGKYFFVKSPEALAFQDKGRRLETTFKSTQVAGSMIDIAQAKGWSKIKVKGDINFRREVWLQAASRGIDIKGYAPQDVDLARLKKLVRDLPEESNKKQPLSKATKTTTKDKITSTSVAAPPFSQAEKDTREAKNAKALLNKNTNFVELAKEHPELINDITAIKMGKKLSVNMSTDADRERFMVKVRERVADNYLQGQRMPPIKIKEEKTVERPILEKETENER
jgi:hypothetical protein